MATYAGMAQLPHLTANELGVLRRAVEHYSADLGVHLASPIPRSVGHSEIATLRAVHTAIAEAQLRAEANRP